MLEGSVTAEPHSHVPGQGPDVTVAPGFLPGEISPACAKGSGLLFFSWIKMRWGWEKKPEKRWRRKNAWSRTSLPVQEIKETRVRFLYWEQPQEKNMATYSRIPVWRIPWTEEPGVHRVAKSQTRLKWQHAHAGVGKKLETRWRKEKMPARWGAAWGWRESVSSAEVGKSVL